MKRNGYGRFKINGVYVSAHRFSYELHNGSVPAGLKVLHTCDHPPCVRPDHLFAGTQKDNVLDACGKGRHRNPVMLGEAHPMAKFTRKQIQEIRAQAATGADKSGLEKKFGLTRRYLNKILKGERWT